MGKLLWECMMRGSGLTTITLCVLALAPVSAFYPALVVDNHSQRRARIAPAQRLLRSPAAQEPPNLDGSGSFRSLVEYPCELSVKIIGVNEGAFVSDMRSLCAGITGQEEELVGVRWRDKGNFRSITLQLCFKDADMVYAVYAAIDQDPRVKFKL